MSFFNRIGDTVASFRMRVRDNEIVGRLPKPYPLEKLMALPESSRNAVIRGEARLAAAVHAIYVQEAGHFPVKKAQKQKLSDSTARVADLYQEHRLASDRPEAERFAETFAQSADAVYRGRTGGRGGSVSH